MNTSAKTPSAGIHAPQRVVALLAALLLAVVVVVFGAAGGAHAHDELTGSDPVDGATVDAVPAAVTFTFSAELLGDGGATEVAVSDPDGNAVAEGDPVVDGAVVTQTLSPAQTAQGTYTVLWKVVSSDGHPISGELTFNVGEASETVPSAPAEEGVPSLANILWIIGGLVLAALLGALVAVLVRRARQGSED